MLDNHPFYSAGSDKQQAEIVGRYFVYILTIDEFEGEIFFQLGQYRFVRTADGSLLVQWRCKCNQIEDHDIIFGFSY